MQLQINSQCPEGLPVWLCGWKPPSLGSLVSFLKSSLLPWVQRGPLQKAQATVSKERLIFSPRAGSEEMYHNFGACSVGPSCRLHTGVRLMKCQCPQPLQCQAIAFPTQSHWEHTGNTYQLHKQNNRTQKERTAFSQIQVSSFLPFLPSLLTRDSAAFPLSSLQKLWDQWAGGAGEGKGDHLAPRFQRLCCAQRPPGTWTWKACPTLWVTCPWKAHTHSKSLTETGPQFDFLCPLLFP